MIVCGAGTGGTVSGISRKIKETCPECKVDQYLMIYLFPNIVSPTDGKVIQLIFK